MLLASLLLTINHNMTNHNPTTSVADCVFCQIVAGKIPSHQIWEDDHHLAFLSIYPNTDGFTVVIPKAHYDSYAFAVPDQVLTDLVLATKQVARLLDQAFSDVGRTGMFFEGFGVNHLHSKLFPMHGTADLNTWQPIESDRDEFYTTYPGYLSSHNAKRADDKQLAQLTKKIKQVKIS